MPAESANSKKLKNDRGSEKVWNGEMKWLRGRPMSGDRRQINYLWSSSGSIRISGGVEYI